VSPAQAHRCRSSSDTSTAKPDHPERRAPPADTRDGLTPDCSPRLAPKNSVHPGFTSHIVDVSPHESRRLLGLFYDELARPEYTVRFEWEPGSIAFWDNRAAVHLAPRDLTLDHDRRLYRVTLVGDVPQGPDGRRSVALDGEPFDAL
jgi:hypothetical protein